MDDLVGYLTLQHVDTVLNISVTAILTVILVLQLLVRRGPVKLHYYFLLAANVLALISSAINEALYNIDTDTTAPGFAMVILIYMSEAFFCLTAAMALRQFTVSYLGGPTFVVTAMCSLAVAASLGFIIVSGFYGQALSTPSSVKHMEILFEADLWTTFAVWVWLLLLLLVIRFTYRSKVPHNENRSIIIKTFGLLSLYIAMIFVYNLYAVITAYQPITLFSQSFGILVGDLVLNIVLYRFSTLLFVLFYNKLSVMAPLPREKYIHEMYEA